MRAWQSGPFEGPLFAGLNVIPKRAFLSEYSCRIDPLCYPKLMQHKWPVRGAMV